MHLKILSAYVICIYLPTLSDVRIEANSVDPDQTAPEGSTLFVTEASKTTIDVTVASSVKPKAIYPMPLVKSAYQKIIFLFLNQNICCGYSKEPSQ